MKKLEELVWKKTEGNYEKWFQQIAEVLMTNYNIKAGSNNYRISECEFYYYCEDHQDETTYGFAKKFDAMAEGRIKRHKTAQRKTLTWFFHYSGIDIVIGNEQEPGGILIRSVTNMNTGEKLAGPLVVLLELLNQGAKIDGSSSLLLELVYVNNDLPKKVTASARVGINSGAFAGEKYNFKLSEL